MKEKHDVTLGHSCGWPKAEKKKENKSALQFVASYCLPQLAVDDPSLALPLPLSLPARLSLLLFCWPRAFRRFIMPFVRARGFYRLFNIYHPMHGCNTNFFGSRSIRSISNVNSEGSSVCENHSHALLIGDQTADFYARNCWHRSIRKISKIGYFYFLTLILIVNWKFETNTYIY